MIEFVKGNIFSSNVEALVNPINCVGVMGKGLALQFKNKYYNMFIEYQLLCKNDKIKIGKMYVYDTGFLDNPKYIINFPTKIHWKNSSEYKYIRRGMDDLVNVIKDKNIKSIAIPKLGCGLGDLDWNIVRGTICGKLQPLLNDVEIKIYDNDNTQTKFLNFSKERD